MKSPGEKNPNADDDLAGIWGRVDLKLSNLARGAPTAVENPYSQHWRQRRAVGGEKPLASQRALSCCQAGRQKPEGHH